MRAGITSLERHVGNGYLASYDRALGAVDVLEAEDGGAFLVGCVDVGLGDDGELQAVAALWGGEFDVGERFLVGGCDDLAGVLVDYFVEAAERDLDGVGGRR